MQRTRIHPLIPTLDETQNNQYLFSSSYLPVFAEVPMDAMPGNNLRMLSYRVLAVGESNNVSKKVDDDTQAELRYMRIANGLKYCARNLNLDVILIQDVDANLMWKKLRIALGDGWNVEPSTEKALKEKPQQLTVYHTKRLSLTAVKKWDDKKRTLSSSFKMDGDKVIHVHNVWSDHYSKFEELENYYKCLLNAADGERTIIFGDTHTGVSPVGMIEPMNLATGVASPLLDDDKQLEGNIQVPSYSNGAFYKDEFNLTNQLMLQVIDIRNGKTVLDSRDLADVTASLSENKLERWNMPQPVLALADYYLNVPLIQDQTIFEYQRCIRSQVGDPTILVRMGSTAHNAKTFYVRFQKERDDQLGLVDSLHEMLPKNSIKSYSIDEGVDRYKCCYINMDCMNEFVHAVDFICDARTKLTALLAADDYIERAKQAIASASKDYGSINSNKGFGKEKNVTDKIWSAGAAFNALVFRPATRAKTIEERIEMASSDSRPAYMALLHLFWEDVHGCSLKSFRYLLASYFVGKQAATNAEAALLISLATSKLATKVSEVYSDWEKTLKAVEIGAKSNTASRVRVVPQNKEPVEPPLSPAPMM